MVKLGPISNVQAKGLSKAFFEMRVNHNYKLRDQLDQDNLKKGEFVLSYCWTRNTFVIAKVTSVKTDMSGEPAVRIADNEYSWRTDGCTRI